MRRRPCRHRYRYRYEGCRSTIFNERRPARHGQWRTPWIVSPEARWYVYMCTVRCEFSMYDAARAHQGTAATRGESGLCRGAPPPRAHAPPPDPPGHHLPVGRGATAVVHRRLRGSLRRGRVATPRVGVGVATGHGLRTAPLLKRGREHGAEARKPDEGGRDRCENLVSRPSKKRPKFFSAAALRAASHTLDQ